MFCKAGGRPAGGVTRLPREVLLWLQSLDLSQEVHQIRRDFSNGLLFAEIFSKFYPKDLDTLMLERGYSLQTKKNNWNLVQQLCMKKNFVLSNKEIDGVLYCETGVAVQVLCKLYSFLTNRKTKTSCCAVKEANKRSNAPSYTKPTASRFLKQPALHLEVDEVKSLKTIRTALKTFEQEKQEQLRDKLTKRYAQLYLPIAGDDSDQSAGERQEVPQDVVHSYVDSLNGLLRSSSSVSSLEEESPASVGFPDKRMNSSFTESQAAEAFATSSEPQKRGFLGSQNSLCSTIFAENGIISRRATAASTIRSLGGSTLGRGVGRRSTIASVDEYRGQLPVAASEKH